MSPTTTSSSSSSPSRASQEDELAELRARVASLEAEVSRRRTSDRTESTTSRRSTRRRGDEEVSDLADRTADAVGRKVEEGSRLIRAMVLTGLEPLRITADATLGFVDELTERAEDHEDETIGDLVTSLPGDLYSGFARALERTVDLIPQSVDTFHERYREARPLRLRRGTRRTATRTTTGAVPRVVSTRPAAASTLSAPDTVTVTFNTEIQPRPLEFGSSIVVRKESVVVPGTESQTSSTTLAWKPAAPLTPGSYTVGVYNVESADGVAMSEPYYFNFTVSS